MYAAASWPSDFWHITRIKGARKGPWAAKPGSANRLQWESRSSLPTAASSSDLSLLEMTADRLKEGRQGMVQMFQKNPRMAQLCSDFGVNIGIAKQVAC